MDSKDAEIIYIALNMRRNYIETGHISYSAVDVQQIGKNLPDKIRINALTTDQMKLIIRIEKMMKYFSSKM